MRRRARTLTAHRRSLSLYLSPDALAALNMRSGLETNDRSATCSVILERYAEIMAAHLPMFSENEWEFLCEVAPEGSPAWTGGRLIAEKRGIDYDKLGNALAALSTVERIAVMDEVERREAAKRRAAQ